MTEVVIGDACSFVNFAVVDRVDLLHDLYGDAIRCTEAVVRELVGLSRDLPAVGPLLTSAGAVLLTDDGATLDYAARKQITAIDTADVLAAAYDRGLLGCPDAYGLLLAMRARERGVRLPAVHEEICP